MRINHEYLNVMFYTICVITAVLSIVEAAKGGTFSPLLLVLWVGMAAWLAHQRDTFRVMWREISRMQRNSRDHIRQQNRKTYHVMVVLDGHAVTLYTANNRHGANIARDMYSRQYNHTAWIEEEPIREEEPFEHGAQNIPSFGLG